MVRIKDRRKDLRPREKLQAKGPEALSDHELLMAIIGSGNAQADVATIARDVQKILQRDLILTMDVLHQLKGLGSAKAAELVAGFELAKRYLLDSERPIINSSEAAVAQLADIRDKKQEYFVCLTLDGASRLIAKRVVTIGTLTSSLVHPREVFADAIADRAASIIIAHNHPSGNLRPSENDVNVTERIEEAAELIGITLCDHIIVTKDSYSSII